MKKEIIEKTVNNLHIVITVLVWVGLFLSNSKVVYAFFIALTSFLWGYRFRHGN